MTRARITGVGAFLPKRILTNADLEKMVETNDAWIVQRTGIRERRIVDENEATSDLAVRAAQQALERANLLPEDVEFIAVGTTSPDMIFPTVGNIVQHRLGCRRAGSVDMLAACAGSIYSLSIGSQFIQTGKYRRVLCIGAETLSRITDFTDRGTCVLLADAAGGASRHPATRETVDARMHYAKMKGNEVFKVAVRLFVDCAERILARNGFTAADVNLFIPHQANLRIIEAAAKRVDLPMDRVFVNVDRYGNTGAASVYVALEEAIAAGRLKRGDLVLIVALGGGFAWGAALMRW